MLASVVLSVYLLPLPIADVDRVLVLQNVSSPDSVVISTAYMKKRGVKNLLKVDCQDSSTSAANETMEYADFKPKIEVPLRAALKANKNIDFIVLTKGIPIRLTNADTGLGNNRPSLDSFIASIDYREIKDAIKVELNDSGFTGKCWANRFWNSRERFSHAKFGGYLVTRLDGYTVDHVIAMIGEAANAEKTKPTGKFLLDVAEGHGIGDVAKVPLSPVDAGKLNQKVFEMAYNDWDADLVACGANLEKKGIPTLVDRTDVFVGQKSDLMGYASWGSNDPKFVADSYATIRFAPGGIAETAVSTSARTFLPTTGGQSLIAELIRAHVTGCKGYCDEPLLQAVASPHVLFDRYTSGWTLAESFYAASRFVGWEDIVIGDPLCAPYK